ncbi:MAG: preprotein translocase subunit SecE [Myxococcota bacterium]|jgi:preprotein translocase subunit SecE|nr:preprotein translocase subunit SecE [Myxococcota bacterium]
MGATRWVSIGFALAGILLAVVLSKTLGGILAWFRVPDFALLGSITVSTAISWIGALAVAFVFWRNPKYNGLANEVAQELRKVTWPTWVETRAATVVVIVTTIIVSIILYVFDLIWSTLTGLIYT